uniref:CSON003262 protein n=1 Tax=Culicoides sonorensis TaxID=179676 RepID=A0A336MLD5_CULSO
MARHRNVRNLNYDDFDDDYVYGHSVEDDCISPTDAQQWIYDRARGQNSMTSFLANHTDIVEEDEQQTTDEPSPKHERRDSDTFTLPDLPDEEKAKLLSCMDEIRGIIGDTSVTDRLLVETIMKYNYDCSKALDHLLNNPTSESQQAIEEDFVEKPQELIEKDLCHEIVQTSLKFKIPALTKKVNVPTELNDSKPSPTNLTELANQHLSSVAESGDSSSKMFLPQLKSGFIIPSIGTKLFIPKLASSKPLSEPDPIKINVPPSNHQENTTTPFIDLSSAILDVPSNQKLILPKLENKIVESKSKSDIIKLMKTLHLEDVTCEIDSRYKIKSISEKLLELSSKQHQITIVPQIVTPATKKSGHVTRGFEVNHTPKTGLSPAGSGRTSPASHHVPEPMHIEDQQPKLPKIRESNRNAKEMYEKERGKDKQNLHMVVIGHVDAGKSTLMGHLLFDMGNVPQRLMHKYEQESKKMGKQSFMYAWVLDETGEERTRGITMDIGSSRFETETKSVTLLDAPGHKDFIPNMISGANQADVALLVVDATRGEFETGFEQGGQTREHALLVKSLGVSQLGVVINKLDTVGWSKERFDEIVTKLKTFLKQAGYKEGDISYIPCSGLTGENLVKSPTSPELLSWYKGPTLISVIDQFRIPDRPIDKPFRMSINDIYKGAGSGFCVSGRIESGVLCINDKILVCPCKEQATVKNISMDEIPQNTVFAGDQVSVTLFGVDITNVSVGNILSDIYRPVPLATRIRARIIVFNITNPITKGYPVVVHHQSLIEPATIVKLKAQLHKSTGEVVKNSPRCLGPNTCALVEIEFTRPICMEKYSDSKELGRVMVRVGGVTIAAGLCTDIVK